MLACGDVRRVCESQETMLGRVAVLAGRALAAACESQQVQQLGLRAAAAASTSSLKEVLQARGFATNSTDVFNIHKDTPENHAGIQFDFTEVSGCPSRSCTWDQTIAGISVTSLDA